MITILGPTASGKTKLATLLAHRIDGEIISADSRQVYRGMDIGTGKDLDDYQIDGRTIPCHLVDIREPGYEYNIFEFQTDFRSAFDAIRARGKTPVLCGGSGMYLETVLMGYSLVKAMDNDPFREVLAGMTDAELTTLLRSYKALHNKTDLEDRDRLIKAILVAEQTQKAGTTAGCSLETVALQQVFGIRIPREILMQRIAARLDARLQGGMIEEVRKLLDSGITPDRLLRYGLEYRYVTLFLQGDISFESMRNQLNIAIRQFAKRQMTWFRRMERRGITIHWIDGMSDPASQVRIILWLIEQKNEGRKE